MSDLDNGIKQYNKMRFGCLTTIGIILFIILISKCMSNSDKAYWHDNKDEPTSINDNPSKL